jgi:hypothetical protein
MAVVSIFKDVGCLKNNLDLKGLSHQIRNAWESYLSIALGWDMFLQY